MMKPLAIAILAALAISTSAHASEVEANIAKFIGAPGFVAEDVTALEASLDDVWLRTEKLVPWGDVGPLEMAVMMVERSIPSTRTRTAMSYGQIPAPDGGPFDFVSFIEVRHYNLGPAIHEETVRAYGADDVADVEYFGLGEHRAWRFVFQPVMGSAAALIEASSREISPDDAAGDACMGLPCLDIGATYDTIIYWSETDGELPFWPRNYPDISGEIATPAHSIAELAMRAFSANAESGQYQWTGLENREGVRGITPFLFVGIDRDLGQETVIDTVWHETALMDDEISELYLRRIDVAGWVYNSIATVKWPGR